MNDEYYMSLAIEEAKKAASLGEVPVGAVIVMGDEVIAREMNSCERDSDPTMHAEIKAISAASRKLGLRRLKGARIYVNLEPCPMCAGAIINAGIEKVIFGAKDENFGAFGGIIDLSKVQPLNGPSVKNGILNFQSVEIIKNFFKKIR